MEEAVDVVDGDENSLFLELELVAHLDQPVHQNKPHLLVYFSLAFHVHFATHVLFFQRPYVRHDFTLVKAHTLIV